MKTLQSKLRHFAPALAGLCFAAVASLATVDAVAQTRAALVRDVDTPALLAVRFQPGVTLSTLNTQTLVTTVPAGKRLVIEQVSWLGTNIGAAQIVFASLRSSQFGTLQYYFQINPPHVAATSGFTIQDGSAPVRIYFEAGEEVWLSVSATATGGLFQTSIHGYLITP